MRDWATWKAGSRHRQCFATVRSTNSRHAPPQSRHQARPSITNLGGLAAAAAAATKAALVVAAAAGPPPALQQHQPAAEQQHLLSALTAFAYMWGRRPSWAAGRGGMQVGNLPGLEVQSAEERRVGGSRSRHMSRCPVRAARLPPVWPVLWLSTAIKQRAGAGRGRRGPGRRGSASRLMKEPERGVLPRARARHKTGPSRLLGIHSRSGLAPHARTQPLHSTQPAPHAPSSTCRTPPAHSTLPQGESSAQQLDSPLGARLGPTCVCALRSPGTYPGLPGCLLQAPAPE